MLGLLAALGLSACSDTVGYTQPTGDKIRGKDLFVKNCGSCHTLRDAATTGKIGPDLDYAFVQSRIDGLGPDTILQVVRAQIAYPVTTPSTGAPGMPANIVKGQDADDVAAYVASVAGLDASGQPMNPANPPKPAPPGGSTDGKAIFASAGCIGCHTLKAADATGTVGPNLDHKGFSTAAVEETVRHGATGMPGFSDQLSATEITQVSQYVANASR